MPERTAGGRRVAVAVAALAAGTATLAGAGWWWQRAQPRPNVGVETVAALATTGPARPSPSGQAVPVQAAALPSAAAVNRPVRVRIGRLGVSARVVPVGVDAAGNVVIPASVDTVGWYRFGPGVGAPGSMVITGHVDSAAQGDGAFARLSDLDPYDKIVVTGSDGRDAAFTVVGREEYPKAAIDLDRYFTTTGPPRLTLVTCGGPFNKATGHYRDNVVVTAVPAG
ncbi:class F sortase [Actinoplanes sp. CA-030573]|uniref:class F sortase n=1 Tax=Actinoplanes sp. CA-030573 TaxID=3239898 RepID=UPI003D927DC7